MHKSTFAFIDLGEDNWRDCVAAAMRDRSPTWKIQEKFGKQHQENFW
ncbi:hypothetical protein [Stanieria cyanosphaera]|nr:hypothetical protein [Stanieria cyanosphaera]